MLRLAGLRHQVIHPPWSAGQIYPKGLINEIMEYLFFLFLFGPGLAITFWLVPAKEFNWFDRIILGLGIGLAFYPVFLLWCYVIGVPINQFVIFSILAVSFVLLAWRIYPSLKKIRRLEFSSFKVNASISWCFLLIVLGLSAYVRVAVVKDLQIPMWADSYHHTMISQLIIENNGLFSSWLPYAPLKTFTYHFGFHSIVASYHWLTGLAIPRSVIVVGQIINFLVVLTCYLLAKQLTGKQWAGNVAALFVGLIFAVPAYYFNWGRYPQLTGLAILPIAILLTIYLFNRPNFDKKTIFITGLAIAGLGLSHYGVLIFFILFGLILTCYQIIQFRLNKPHLKVIFLNFLGTSTIVGLIAAPWIWNFLSGHFLTIVTDIVKQAPGADAEKIKAHNRIPNVINAHWYLLTIIGILWALWYRNKEVILISIWVFLLLVLANPQYVKLPGTGLINNFAVFTSFFLPFSIIFGNFLGDLVIKSKNYWYPWTTSVLIIMLLLLGLRGVKFRLGSFNPEHQLVTNNDVMAMTWIQENIPENASFLINHSFAYNNSSVVGTDAGWWLPLLGRRQNTIPPLSFQEVRYPDAFKSNKFYRKIDQVDLSDLAGYRLLTETGITHIYIGQQNGQVWNETGQEPFNINLLRSSDFYEEIYHQDNVSVFVVKTGGNTPE